MIINSKSWKVCLRTLCTAEARNLLLKAGIAIDMSGGFGLLFFNLIRNNLMAVGAENLTLV